MLGRQVTRCRRYEERPGQAPWVQCSRGTRVNKVGGDTCFFWGKEMTTKGLWV